MKKKFFSINLSKKINQKLFWHSKKSYFLKRAFTLIEMIVILFVIAILLSVAIISFNSSRSQALNTKILADVRQMQGALRLYYNDYKAYPTTEEWAEKERGTSSGSYLSKIPKHPKILEDPCQSFGEKYIYESDGKTYTLKFCLGKKVSSLSSGINVAIPDGVFALDSVPSVSEPTWRVIANSSIPGTGSESSRDWYSVSMSADGRVILLGTGTVANPGYLYLSVDGGVSFSELTSLGKNNSWLSDCSADGTKMIAVSRNSSWVGQIVTSNDSGSTWVTNTAAGTRNWHGLGISDDGNTLLAVVYKGYPFVSTNAGTSWTQRGVYAYYSCASCSADCSKMLASAGDYNKYVMLSSNSGVNWSAQTSMPTRLWYINSISDDGTKMIVGSVTHSNYPNSPRSPIYISTDSGSTWILREPISGDNAWYGGAYSGDGSRVVVANYGDYIYISDDDGETWEAQSELGKKNWFGIAVSANGQKIVAVVLGGDVYIYE